MYGVVENIQPKKALFLGSYYGYWAIWALLAYPNLHITLVDIDQTVCDLARENFGCFGCFGLLDRVTIICDDGQQYIQKNPEQYDLLIIDAECPHHESVDEQDRGKGIYLRLVKAALPQLAGPIICHNILVECDTGVSYLERKIPKNLQELNPFRNYVIEQGFSEICCHSTEGIGFYVK